MKTSYKIFLTALCVVVLSWFLPWLYSLIFPSVTTDPFIAYSPVSDSFIVSEHSGGRIYAVDKAGTQIGDDLTKEDRDSMLPHIYYTQLVAQGRLPDSINGMPVSVRDFKHAQWVFNSSPRDLNKVPAKVHLVMESMPARIDLENPREVFRLNGKVEFVNIETNSVSEKRSKRFNEIFTERGFEYPAKSLHANITTRKPYDEGYLIIDNKGDIFHMKMQAGRPYMVKVQKPDSVIANHVFVLENIDTRPLGLISDTNNNLYVLEHQGYKLIHLPVGKVNLSTDKLSVMKNIFNWVVKMSDSEESRWVALDSHTYNHLAGYSLKTQPSKAREIAGYIFPFELSFTSVYDCFAFPRIEFFSWKVIFLNIFLAVGVLLIFRREKPIEKTVFLASTLLFGIFVFIPLVIILGQCYGELSSMR